jgi:hypothetical protein
MVLVNGRKLTTASVPKAKTVKLPGMVSANPSAIVKSSGPIKKAVIKPPVPGRSLIERPDMTAVSASTHIGLPAQPDQGGDIFSTTADIFGSILGAAVKTVETFPSTINTVSKNLMGSQEGIIDTAAREIGKTPVGDLARAANTVLNAGWNAVGGLMNQPLAAALAESANLPDDAPVPYLFGLRNPLLMFTQGEQDINTVGDLRRLAAQRNFTPEQIASVASGASSSFDFGTNPLSTNPIVDIGYRLALDPMNLAMAGGPSLVKGVLKSAEAGLRISGAGAEVMPALKGAGFYLKDALDAKTVGKAISAGRYREATWAGVGHYLKDVTKTATLKYAKVSVAGTVGLVAANAAAPAVIDFVGKKTPLGGLLSDFEDLSTDIINDRPLSESSTFALIAAVGFPLHGLMKDAGADVRVTKAKLLKGDGAAYAIAKHVVPDGIGRVEPTLLNKGRTANNAAKVEWMDTHMAGGAAAVIDHIDTVIAYLDLKKNAANLEHYRSLANAVVAGKEIAADALRHRDEMRARGLITNAQREDIWVGWATGNRAWTGETLGRRSSQMKMAYDPERAVAAWNNGFNAAQGLNRVFSEFGNVTSGFDAHLNTESIARIHATVKDYTAADGKTITAENMRRFMYDNPAIVEVAKMAKKGDWWVRFESGQAPSTNIRTLRGKLNGFQSYVPDAADVFKSVAGFERKAPPPVRDVAPFVGRLKRNDSMAVGEQMAKDMAAMDEASSRAVMSDYLGGVTELHWDQSILNEMAKGTLKQDDLAKLAGYQKILEDYGTPYTLTIAPENPLIWSSPGKVDPKLLQHGALAQWVMDHGAFSAPARFAGWLLDPVPNRKLAADARQAVYDEAVGKYGLPAEKVDLLFQQLQEHVADVKFMGVGLFRSSDALIPDYVNKIAENVFGASNSPRWRDFVDSGDSMSLLIDRASSRYWRTLQDKIGAMPSGRLSAMAETLSGKYEGFAASGAGRGARMIGKVFYPIFRFTSDPRWWAMNYLEADMLAGFQYGLDRTARNSYDVATATHKIGKPPGAKHNDLTGEITMEDESGMMFHRNLAGPTTYSFMEGRKVNMEVELRKRAESDPAIVSMLDTFGDGDSPAEYVRKLDDMLYQYDMQGVKRTFEMEQKRLHYETAMQNPDFREMMNLIFDENQKTYDAVYNTFGGNPSRSNLERTLNSYWLYWPLSYQLKAGKWMFDVLTKKGVFGPNLTGAYWFNNVATKVTNLIANDPDYVKFMKQNESLFMFGQMMFPITPTDFGLSLNKLVRAIGGWIDTPLREGTGSTFNQEKGVWEGGYLGGYLGLWPPYNNRKDPVALAQAAIEMGPVYTYNLLGRVSSGLQQSNLIPNFSALPEGPVQ